VLQKVTLPRTALDAIIRLYKYAWATPSEPPP
jgi:hypothetical protein